MARRSIEWNEGLANVLGDRKFTQAFIQEAFEDGFPLQVARAINPNHNATIEIMNKLLKPFGLEVAVAPSPKAA